MRDLDDTRSADVREARRRIAILLGEKPDRPATGRRRGPAETSRPEIADPDYYAWRECLKARRT